MSKFLHSFSAKADQVEGPADSGGPGGNGYPQYLAPIETKTFFLKYPTSASASDPPQIFRPSAGPELSAGEAVIRTLQIVVHSVHCKLLLLLHI